MSECHEIQPLVSAHLDGELDENDDAMVRRHLELCPDCCQLRAEWEIADQWMAASVPVPSEFQLERVRGTIRVRRPWNLFRRIAGMSTAAVLLVALAISWGMRPQPVAALTIAEPFVRLHRIQRVQDRAYSSTVQTLEWELRTMKLELESSNLADDQKRAFSSQIELLLRRLQPMQQVHPDLYEQGT